MPLKYRVSARRLAAGLLAVLLLLICTGCEQFVRLVSFADFLTRTDDRRIEFCMAETPDISAFTPDLRGRESLISEEEQEALTTAAPLRAVSAEEARADVDTAFRLLKHSYGAYDYFGGDAVFNKAKREILAALPDEGEVTPAVLEKTFFNVLDPILRDGHFYIGYDYHRSPGETQCWYVPDLYFSDATAVGGSAAEYVRVTVDKTGRLQFCLVAYVTEAEAEDLPESTEIDGETVALTWERDVPVEPVTYDAFTETTLGGIPYLIASQMDGVGKEQEAQLERFAESGEAYADAPLVVLDLRGNGGGYVSYAYDWFTGYTGEYPMIPEAWAMKYSKLNVYTMIRDGTYDLRPSDVLVGEWDRYDEQGWYTPRDGITFVLADKNTASAAEMALLYILTLENAVIVGGNSAGCSLTSNPFTYYLPHSGLPLYFGTALSLVGDLGNFDGIGIEPDIWTPSRDAAAAVLRMVEYYGLDE